MKIDLSQYTLDHYGNCALGPLCICLQTGRVWKGTECPNWMPWAQNIANRRKALQEARTNDSITVGPVVPIIP